MKRFIDFWIALFAVLLLCPFLLLLALLVKLDSKGEAFFRQERVGRNGKNFVILKFRTMVSNAREVGPGYTIDGDQRITRLGKYLRRSSIDELPQLINVLTGDMSLVGPRPDLPNQEGDYTEEEWRARHQVRPGITGLAQATLRSQATLEQRKSYDLRYVAQHSLWMDVRILLATVRQVFGRGGN